MTSDLIHLEFACPARTPLSLRLKDISNLLPFNQFTFSIFRTHRKLGNAAESQAQPSPQPVSTTRVSWTDIETDGAVTLVGTCEAKLSYQSCTRTGEISSEPGTAAWTRTD